MSLLRLAPQCYVDPDEVVGVRLDRNGTTVVFRGGGEVWARDVAPATVAAAVEEAATPAPLRVRAPRYDDERGAVDGLVSSVAVVLGLAVAAYFFGVDLFAYLADARDWLVNLIENMGGDAPDAPERPARHKEGPPRNV